MMAKVVSINKGGDGEEPRAKTTIKAITASAFSALVKRCKALRTSLNTDKATLGGIIGDACANKNLHKGAYGIFSRLDAMDPYKRAELLFHFDIYRSWAKWDQSIEADMFDRSDEAAE